MEPLKLDKKVDRPGFMLACDKMYFRNWGKSLSRSITHHAPWAHVHFHLFDPDIDDVNWCLRHGASVSSEPTHPDYKQDHENQVLYWSAARYMRVPDIYEDSVPVINLDVDSIMVKCLPQSQFERDLTNSWVPTTPPGKRRTLSLCSAIGFAADRTRYLLRDRLLGHMENSRLSWALDQQVCDELLALGQITSMDLRYTDFKFSDGSYIWTGKGERVYKSSFLQKQKEFLDQ